MNYQLQYVIGPKAVQKPKKGSKVSEGGNAGEKKGSEGAYAEAEKEFKLQWLRCGESVAG